MRFQRLIHTMCWLYHDKAKHMTRRLGFRLLMCFAFSGQSAIAISAVIGMITSTMGSISLIGIIVIGNVGADVVGMIVVLVTLIMIAAAPIKVLIACRSLTNSTLVSPLRAGRRWHLSMRCSPAWYMGETEIISGFGGACHRASGSRLNSLLHNTLTTVQHNNLISEQLSSLIRAQRKNLISMQHKNLRTVQDGTAP